MSNNSIISCVFPPSIIALCIPNYSKGRQNIESTTPIELSSKTPGVLIFFSLNGRRPDPLETWNRNTATCIQYDKPFTFDGIAQLIPGDPNCLHGSGLRTIRALAVDERITNPSAVVTKTFYVKDVSDPSQVVRRSKTNSLRLRMSGGKSLKKAATETTKSNNQIEDEQHEEREIEDEIEQDDRIGLDLENFGTNDIDIEDEIEFVPEIANEITEELQLEEATNQLTPISEESELDEVRNQLTLIITEEHSNEVVDPCIDREISRTEVKDSSLQCVIASECSDKSIQVSCKCKDVGNQATVAFRSQAIQTLSQEKEQQPIRTIRKGSIDAIIRKNTCGTQTRIDQTDAETETICLTDNDRKESATTRTSALKTSQVSPGRGYWRQQMDHIASQLKAEACNNLEFRDSIMEQRITKLNRVSLHEGLDDLVLVLNFGLQRASIKNVGFDQRAT